MNITAAKAIYSILAAMVVLVGGYIASYKTAPPAENVIGAVSGNEIQGNEFVLGGVHNWQYSDFMHATTSNPCTFKTPNATTTFVRATAGTRMTAGNLLSSTITKLAIATGPTSFSTTTELGYVNMAAAKNAELAVFGTTATTSGTPTSAFLLPPNTYVNVSVIGTTTLGIGLAGVCTATLQSL